MQAGKFMKINPSNTEVNPKGTTKESDANYRKGWERIFGKRAGVAKLDKHRLCKAENTGPNPVSS